MSQFDLSEVLVCAEQLLTVLVGDDTEAVTLQNIHQLSRQVAALRQKQLQQLKQDVQCEATFSGSPPPPPPCCLENEQEPV